MKNKKHSLFRRHPATRLICQLSKFIASADDVTATYIYQTYISCNFRTAYVGKSFCFLPFEIATLVAPYRASLLPVVSQQHGKRDGRVNDEQAIN